MGDSLAQNKVIMKKIELPPGMTPFEAVDKLQRRLDRYVSHLRHTACANAVITSKPASYDPATVTVDPGDVVFSDDDCKNPRRNGSRFCQACSDKYHAGRK